MVNTLLPSDPWAQAEFSFAPLPDQRLNKRLMNIASALATHPGGTLPQAFPHWAELKAAYRFFAHPKVSFQKIIAPHLERTQGACRQPGEYVIIEDTTELSYTGHPATQELGPIGDGRGRGLQLHSALAVRVEAWTLEQRPEGTVVGLLGQRCWSARRTSSDSRPARYSTLRKSRCWAASFQDSGSPPEGSHWIYVADRESDFYEPMQTCQRHGIDFVIRAYHNRRLAGAEGHLLEALAAAPVLGRTTLEVRARAGCAARTARVEMRGVRVDLDGPWRPGGWQPALSGLWAVEVREVHDPQGVSQPLHWMLLTSLPCGTQTQAQRVVGYYAARWWIEEYHKALKSGAGVEDSQLERAYRLESLVAVLAVVAVRLLSTKFLARSRPDGWEAASSFGPEMLQLLEAKVAKPKEGWTNHNLLVAIARVGGFLARKHDGPPGWQTIWRGWQRLIWMRQGVAALNT